MPNVEYTTISGDRWDTIAAKAYGDETAIKPIQDANPNIPLTDVFKGGIKLIVPVSEEVVNSNLDLLPPWKRVQVDAEASIDQAAADAVSTVISTTQGSFDNKSFD